MQIDTGYDYELGARRARKNKSRGNVRTSVPGRNSLILPPQPRAFASAIPGVPTQGRRVRPMGLGIQTFNSTSG